MFAFVLALSGEALAADDSELEPNDGIHQAYGGLKASTDYDARISSTEEEDWYIVYVSGQGNLVINFNNQNDASDGEPKVYLLTRDGVTLNSTSFVDEGASEELKYSTPGPGHYYIVVDGYSSSDDYRMTLTGPIVDGPRPGTPEPTPNASRELSTAFGPLAGGKLYGGSIDAVEEKDWFFFYTAGAGTFDLAMTNIADSSDGEAKTYLRDAAGKELKSTNFVDPNTIEHIVFTAPGPTKYAIEVAGYTGGDQYQFEITPASLLTSIAPPPTPVNKKTATKACKDARASRKKAAAKLKVAQAKVKLAKARKGAAASAKARRKWAKKQRKFANKAKKRRDALKAVNATVKTECA